MAFPDSPLDVQVELNLGGVWTDVTADVRTRDDISITRGRADESASVEPSRCTLTLDNRDGKYSPRNPVSPYFGQLGRNTPIRVSVPNPDTELISHLVMDGDVTGTVSTPSSSALNITGDIDIRIDLQGIDWSVAATSGNIYLLASKLSYATGQESWHIYVNAGVLTFEWYNATTSGRVLCSTAALTTGRVSLLAALDVDNGAGGYTAAIYYGPSMTGPWTLLDAPKVGAAPTSIGTSTEPVRVGGAPTTLTDPDMVPFAGTCYGFQIRNGIEGPVVADADFSAQAGGATSWVGAQGNTWTVNGTAHIVSDASDRSVRFFGEVASWPTRWEPSGNDVWTPIEAAGIMRRLGQGAKPVESPIRRTISANPNLVAYWPMEDVASSSNTKIFSPVTACQPMRTSGFEFAQDGDLPGSAPLPTVTAGAVLRAEIPPAPAGNWRAEFYYKLDSAPSAESTLLWFKTVASTTDKAMFLVNFGTANQSFKLITKDNDGENTATLISATATQTSLYGQWNRLVIIAAKTGSSTDYFLSVGPAGGDIESFYSGSSNSGNAGRLSEVRGTITGLDGASLGHIATFATGGTWAPYSTGSTAFYRERVGDRLARLADEGGVPLTQIGFTLDTPRMGDQPVETILDTMADTADADSGMLGESIDTLSLQYRTRSSIYNQVPAVTLDYSELTPLEPTDDDQATRNDVTVSTPAGQFARIVQSTGPMSVQPPPLGVGTYDDDVTLNLMDDTLCVDHAGWRVHLGTWDEARYPAVDINLAAAPDLIPSVVAMRLLDRIQITNTPVWLPGETIDLIVQGYQETLSPYGWSLSLNCSPAGPWTVGVIADHADTEGSALVSGVTSSATSLSVATTSGPVWTTTPSDFPLDISVGGETMTVTAISGAASPQTFTVTRSVNGAVKAQAAGTAVSLAVPAIVAL